MLYGITFPWTGGLRKDRIFMPQGLPPSSVAGSLGEGFESLCGSGCRTEDMLHSEEWGAEWLTKDPWGSRVLWAKSL